MKHLVICFVCLVLIGLYTAFSYIYIDNFTSDVKSEIKYSIDNNYPEMSVERINDIFYKKKKTLDILVNTEHIDLFQNSLFEFENSVKYNNYQDAEVNSKVLLNIIDTIEKNNKNII